MTSSSKPLHARNIPGIESRAVTTWRGNALRGLYFIESKLPEGAPSVPQKKGPVILLPGSWDPREGEYSDNLLRKLLQESGAPAVLEAHYHYTEQYGYVDPVGLTDDLTSIFLDPVAAPTVVALCFACPFVLEALLAAREQHPKPPVAGVMVIGQGVPGFLNTVGRLALRSHINMKTGAEERHLRYTGHSHIAGNNARGEAWAKHSRLVAALDGVDLTAPIRPFPVPVEAVYFRLDVATSRARTQLKHVFGITGTRELLPGYHRSLRRRSPADSVIAQFYEEMQQRVVGDVSVGSLRSSRAIASR